MTRYYKTSYGYRSGDNDGVGIVLGGLLLLALIIWIFSVIFIPLAVITVLYVVYYCCSEPQNRSSGMLIFLLIVTTIAGICFAWQIEEKAAPKISLSLSTSFLDKYDIEPLLGETITQDGNGDYYVTLTDHCISYDNSCSNTPDIKVEVKAEGDSSKKIKAELSVTQVGMKRTSDMPFWMQSDNEYFENKVLYKGENLSYTINGDDLRFNESSYNAEQPTKFIIEAKNDEGSERITLTVTKFPVYMACKQYGEEHSGSNDVNDVKLCRDRQEHLAKKEAEKAEKEKAEAERKNNAANSGNGTSNGGTSGGASQTCAHYEAGRCWDDLELEAYDQGRYDKAYGRYGQSYYESGDCNSVCQSILEEAYDEGYYGY